MRCISVEEQLDCMQKKPVTLEHAAVCASVFVFNGSDGEGQCIH